MARELYADNAPPVTVADNKVAIPYTDYSKYEDLVLEKLAGRISCVELAKTLGRTYHSVNNRCRRLGISRRCRDGWFCERDVSSILGVDHRTVSKYIHDGTLRGSWKSEGLGDKPRYAVVLTKDLRKFIVDHPTELANKKVDLTMIIYILSGKLN